MGKSIHIKFKDDSKPRNPYAREHQTGGGQHHNREEAVGKGSSRKEKHKKDWTERDAEVAEDTKTASLNAMQKRVASLWLAQQGDMG